MTTQKRLLAARLWLALICGVTVGQVAPGWAQDYATPLSAARQAWLAKRQGKKTTSAAKAAQVLKAPGTMPRASQGTTLVVTPSTDPDTLVAALTQGSRLIQNLKGSFVRGPFTQTIGTDTAVSSGTYTNSGDKLFGIPDGIVLSSGDVRDYGDLPAPMSSGTCCDPHSPTCGQTYHSGTLAGTSTRFNGPGYPPLDAISGQTTEDATVFHVEFDASPTCNSLQLQFVFGSEEFPEFVDTEFNDVFAVFVNGKNVAVDQASNLITINNALFECGTDTELDGNSILLTVRSNIAPGSHNTIEIAVADAGDAALDSTVYATALTGSTLVVNNCHVGPLIAVHTAAESGPDSLREAILYANTHPATTIRFEIPDGSPGFDGAAGAFVIRPQTPLPALTGDCIVLEGATQADVTGDSNPTGPEIVIDGSLAGAGADGLTLSGTNCIVQGVAVGNFAGAGIRITGAAAQGNIVQGCYLGTNAHGDAAAPNGDGIRIDGGAVGSLIGFPSVLAGNVLSGNRGAGLAVSGAGTAESLVRSNLIGLNAAGTGPLPNGGAGVALLAGTTLNTIGSPGRAANRISRNAGDGVLVSGDSSGNAIRGNVIVDNARLGINLAGGSENSAGVTANDAGDVDTGPNTLQNYPILTNATTNGTSSVISGTLDSTPGSYLIDLYRITTGDPSGFGEGDVWLGSSGIL